MLGALPAIHPQVPERLIDPGPFMTSLGNGAALFFVLAHAVFGALVGIAYGPVLHGASAPREAHVPTYGRRTA